MSGLKLKERAEAVNKAAVDRGDGIAQSKRPEPEAISEQEREVSEILLSLPGYKQRGTEREPGKTRSIYYTDRTRERIENRTQGGLDNVVDFLINYALDSIEKEGVTLTVTRDGKVLRSI